MTRRPIATIRVLPMPQLGEGAIRIEVSCPAGRTGITQIPAPNGVELPVPALITAVTFRHEESCSACDTSEAHARGHAELRAWTEETWARVTAESVRRHLHGRRN